MATAANRNDDRNVSIGTILSRAFGVLGDNPVATFGIAFLFGVIPQQLFGYFLRAAILNADPQNFAYLTLLSLSSIVMSILFAMIVSGALVRATTAYAEGSRASLGESLSVGLSMAVPLLGVVILMSLGLTVGFILLFVPGIILAIMWAVTVPALVSEKTGVIEAFGRSRFLTKGARWTIFGLYLLVGVAVIILFSVIGAIIGGGMMAMASGGTGPFTLIISAVLGTATSAFGGALQTSIYISLRNWKEGPHSGALADVFA